jgi:hypothetical protein
MNPQDRLIFENALAGCETGKIAEAFGISEAAAGMVVHSVLHTINEWIASGFHPFFNAQTLESARREKIRVLAIIDEIEKWDEATKPVAILVFEGVSPPKIEAFFPIGRQAMMDMTIDAVMKISAYVPSAQLPELYRIPATWVKANRARAIAYLERVPSFKGVKRLSKIEFQPLKIE